MLDGPTFPEDWPRRPIYELATWTNGLAFRDFQFSDSGWPVIKIAELKEGVSGQTKFTRQTFHERYHVKNGDMLFSWSGNPETSLDVFWWRRGDGWLNQHIFKVEPTDVDSGFFYYLLRYLRPTFGEIAANKQTTGLGHVTAGDLKSLLVGVPPSRVQQNIAHVLGSLDDKIELNRRMSQTLEQIAQALFKFWFVDFGPVHAKAEGRWQKGRSLPGMPSDMWDLWPSEFEESEIGEIPKGWDVRPLAEVADISQGSTPSTEVGRYWDPPEHDWVTVKDLSQTQNSILMRTDRKVSQTGLGFLGSKVVPSGSILLSTGAPIGYVAIPTIPVVLGTRVAALQPRTPLGQSYLFQWTRANIEAFRDAANGTTFPQLLLSRLREFPILVPSDQALSRFESLLSSAQARVGTNAAESVGLAATRDILLPKLLSGEIRVSVGGGA